MYKHAAAHSLLMIFMLSSFSLVSAIAPPIRIVQRQTNIGQPISSPPPSPPQSSPAATIPASRSPILIPPGSASQSASLPTGPSAPTTPTVPTQSTSTSSSASVSSSTTDTSTTSATSVSVTDPVTSTSTDALGQVTVVTTVPATADISSASPSPTNTGGSSDDSSKTGTIIGLSVAGGVAAIAVIGFIIWKLTRKRFSDFDDPDEAIKWPELNRETHMGGEHLSRQASDNTFSNMASRNVSSIDQSQFADPYAVPPLPQFNPSQPYRDDPSAYNTSGAGYYDPYHGPVPQTLHSGLVDEPESIPMSTYPSGSRSRSPGPGPSYDMGGRGSPAPGRASPAPGAIYDTGERRGTPAPGRTLSPGPAVGLGV